MTSTLPPASSATIQNQPTTAQTTQEGIVSNEKKDARNREDIALAVLIASIVAVFALSVTVIWSANSEKRQEAAQNVMSSTLPLYGTWVGTILAFYFSRNAFEAASSATDRNLAVFQQGRNELVSASPPDNKLANIPLKALANGLIFSCDYKPERLLQEIVDELNDKNRYRVIVVDANTKVYVDLVYRINASAYLTQQPQSGETSQSSVISSTLTLQDYLNWQKEQGDQVVVFLPETATLAEADTKMKETSSCKDVIVTTDGKETSPVVAYVTDNDINEYR